MSDNSHIEWTDATWNPIVGCSIVSPGCTNCYAMKMAARIQKMNRTGGSGSTYVNHYDGTTKSVNGKIVWTGTLAIAPDRIFLQPLGRKSPTTYFVNSMGDLFHEDVPDEWIDRVFAVMALAPQHTFQILTKRAKRMRAYLSSARAHPVGLQAFGLTLDAHARDARSTVGTGVILQGDIAHLKVWPLPNVWLGVSTERQQEADERIPLLLQTPAAVRFVSAEPLLGPLALDDIVTKRDGCEDHLSALECDVAVEDDDEFGGATLDWVICGGESGPAARPMHPDWARGLRDQCAAAGVPFFFKQWGEWIPFYDRDRDDPDWRNVPQVDNQIGIGATRFHNLAGGIGFHGDRLVEMRNVGKKKAGRLLDGVEHSEFPDVV